ncbi:MAG: WecB/TagA/CpsF family glycosyltransferase [Bacteroidota bacterium]
MECKLINKFPVIETFLTGSISKNVFLYGDFNVLNYLYESELKYDTSAVKIYPDSTAVHFALKIFSNRKEKMNVSTDILDSLLKSAVSKRQKIFFFGDSDDVLDHLTTNLKKEHDNILINGVHNGYLFKDDEVIEKINDANTEILFVGLGAGRQEKWITNNHVKLNCNLIVSCGGWFQYLAGYKKRAPSMMIQLHLEWLYKLITEFSRVWYRYLIGIPKFYYRIITKKIILSFDS